jgi:transposase
MNLLLSLLSDQQRRLYAAIESNRIGRGGVKVMSQVTGLSAQTIAKGRAELADAQKGTPPTPDPRTGGRPRATTTYPSIENELEALLSDEIAGDPMSDQKWFRNSVENLSQRLKERGIEVSGQTVYRLLKRMGYSMKYSKKRRDGSRHNCLFREEQFAYIALKKGEFRDKRMPVISVDTKKTELIGLFRNKGRSWCKAPPEVNAYDYRSEAECRAVPLGIYDVGRNKGYVVVGVSNNTPEFTVNGIVRWWTHEGKKVYPTAREILILADGGGSNGCRSKGWKVQLQQKVCDELGLTVTVSHYPRGCSKWNPVERRLFSQISNNWAGRPLKTLSIMLGYIRGTTTTTGLTVTAHLDESTYAKGKKVSAHEVEHLALTSHTTCPKLNYTLKPRSK